MKLPMAKSYYHMLFNIASSQNVLPKSMEKSFLAEEFGETSNQMVLTMSDFKSSAKDASICHKKVEHFAKEALSNIYSTNVLEAHIIKSSLKRKQQFDELPIKPMTANRSIGRSQSKLSDILPSQIRMETEDVDPIPEDVIKEPEPDLILGMNMDDLLVSKDKERKKKRVDTLKLADTSQTGSTTKMSNSRVGFLSSSKTNLISTSRTKLIPGQENQQKAKEEARKKKIEEVMEMMAEPVVQMETSCKGPKSFKLFYELPRDAILKEEDNFNAIIEALRQIPDNDAIARHFQKRYLI